MCNPSRRFSLRIIRFLGYDLRSSSVFRSGLQTARPVELTSKERLRIRSLLFYNKRSYAASVWQLPECYAASSSTSVLATVVDLLPVGERTNTTGDGA
jgi:hypothetical protein